MVGNTSLGVGMLIGFLPLFIFHRLEGESKQMKKDCAILTTIEGESCVFKPKS